MNISHARDPGPYKRTTYSKRIEVVQATEPQNLTLDGAGYFIVYPDERVCSIALWRQAQARHSTRRRFAEI